MYLYNIVPVLIGAGVTWLAAWLYYKKAGDKLKQEATELRRLTNLVLHGLEDAGLVKLKRDASGKIMGLIVELSGEVIGVGSMSARAEVIQHKSPNHSVPEASDVNSAKNSG
jgi:hypothetical protein